MKKIIFISGTTAVTLCCCLMRAVLISAQHLLFFPAMSEHLRWGNAGRWPLDNLYSALRPHTPSTQLCHDSRMAGPACPACSSPGEGTACQRISSQPSIYFLPVCTLSWFTCEESRSTSVQDVASLFLNFPPPSTLSLSFPWVSHSIISFHYVELKPRSSIAFF